MNFNSILHKSTLKNDISGGLLAAIIGLPMALAFGVQSGLGAQAGIYTAIILALVASVVGGTKTLISDPTGPMTIVAATVVTLGVTATGELSTALPLILATFVLAGVFELIFGLLDFGKYVKFMPYPVVSSFMAGIGIIIISMQLFPLLGHVSPKGFINIISQLHDPISNVNSYSLGLGLLTLAIIFLLPKITTKLPSILVALVVSTFLSVIFRLDVPVIGTIPQRLPKLHLTELFSLHWLDLKAIVKPALLLGGLGVIDSLLTSVVADNLTKTKHDSRRTIIGQGLGNILVGLFGGIPGAGATMGTVSNIKAGGLTKFSGFMKGIFLLIIVVSVSDYVAMIPMSVLAGILIFIGISIIDYKGIKMLLQVPKQDALVWLIVLFFTIFDNLLNAVAAGFVLASVLFIGQVVKGMKKSHKESLLEGMVERKEIPEDLAKSIYVQNLDGPLFFGFANQYRALCSAIDDMMIIIIRMNNVPFLDQSGLVTLETVIQDWHDRGIQVYICDADEYVKSMLVNIELIPDLVSEQNYFGTFRECIAHIKGKVDGKHDIRQFESALLERHVLKNRMRKIA